MARARASTSVRLTAAVCHTTTHDRLVETVRLYDGATARLLGTYCSVAAALAAADVRSVAAVAAANDWVLVEHYLVRVDEEGGFHVGSEVTHVGPPDDLEGCRAWLRTLPGREP